VVTPWTKAFWGQAVYYYSWAIVSPGIFWLCRRLYEGKYGWWRYAVGLVLGAVVVVFVHPALSNSIEFAISWLKWGLSLSPDKPVFLLSKLGNRIAKLSGPSIIYYSAIVLGWHAVRYYREKHERETAVLELEASLRQAQLQALRSQLHPHFIFNTLNTIAELVHENPKVAEQLILRLGELLRQVLKPQTSDEVPLAQELDFIKGYLEIEQARLGERLQVNWDVASDTLQAKVPGLILQPLVENAVQHGIAPFARAGKLVIRAVRDNGFLCLQVRDSGPGLPDDIKARPLGIGLSNTQTRLQRLYGERQRFELINDNGLVVNLRLPLMLAAETEKTNS
jgi:signal transduction histidine kinase